MARFVNSRGSSSRVEVAALRVTAHVTIGVILILILTIALAPTTSSAVTVNTEILADRSGWYWEQNRRLNPPGVGAQQEVFPVAAQKDHIQVAVLNSREDKRAYIGFNLGALEGFSGATVRSFTLTAQVSPATQQHTNEHTEQARQTQTVAMPSGTSGDSAAAIVACPVVNGIIVDGADGDPVVAIDGSRIEPEFECNAASAPGRRAPDGGSWTFDLAPIAELWAEGATPDTALVLKPATAAGSWTVEFHGRALKGMQARVTYTPPASDFEGTPFEIEEAVPPATAAGPFLAPNVTEEVTEPPAPPVLRAAPAEVTTPVAAVRFPWWAALPWPAIAGGIGLAYWALREGPRGAEGTHRVAALLRRRRELTGNPR